MMSLLDTHIGYLKGVGPKRAALLEKEIGVTSFGDLLYHFPFRYEDRSKIIKISDINSDAAYIQVVGNIHSLQVHGGKRASRITAVLSDDSGSIELVWFKGLRWIKDQFTDGKKYLVFGKPSRFKNKFNLVHPEIEALEESGRYIGETLQGIYPTTDNMKSNGLGSRQISKLMQGLIVKLQAHIPENIPERLLQQNQLMARQRACKEIHFPVDTIHLNRARFRLKYEELLLIQLQLLQYKTQRQARNKSFVFSTVGDHLNSFYTKYLPFELTAAQKRVVREIRHDLNSGLQMNRLLQGDVGSGKTVVALMIMLIALDNGFQSCLMAPTEILATQHYRNLLGLLKQMNIQIALLTGSTKTSERKIMLEQLKSGHLDFIIGTHALLEDPVVFHKLGFVVIDEQHRFGVEQRAKLWKKADKSPHILVMTATPIPRTLAMTLYGDLDLSVIDELPKGRKPVKTMHFFDNKRLQVFRFLKGQIQEGRQVFIVYPLIQESENLDIKDLMDGYESICREFPAPEYQVGVVHGKMRPDAKDFEMQRFVAGKSQILVSTTVIEVGVDVPNATVMVIENAERFGLSQLHQLRGRVGRGADQSYCLLMSSHKLTADARTRLKTMVETNDGFEIAAVDLKLRGPGDLQGTRQSGVLDLKIANLVSDEALIKQCRNDAMQLLQTDPELSLPQNNPIRRHLDDVRKRHRDWSQIS